jgi:PASTA domain-containing protein
VRALTVVSALIFALSATTCDGNDGPSGSTPTGAAHSTGSATEPPQLERVEVPTVEGLLLANARSRLRSAELHPVVAGKTYSFARRGTVFRQSLDPGTEVRPDRVVRLTITKPFPPPVNGNPWLYNFACCRHIYDPPAAFCSYFNCIPYFSSGVGYVIQCEDGAFSQSGGRSGSCSSHGGNWRPILRIPGG